MKNNLCIDITGRKSGSGDLFVSQLLDNLNFFLNKFNKIIIFIKDDYNINYKNNKIICFKIPFFFRNRYLLFYGKILS